MKRYLRRWLARVVLVLVVTWLVACVVLATIVHHTGTIDEAVRSDVIIVFGAALTRDGKPYRALTRRAEHAASLWKGGYARAILCTGGIGAHVRVPRSEADGCREVLVRHGVPPSAIVVEERSRSTEENARHARPIMAAHGWTRAILVSDSYHVFRARTIARHAGIGAVISPVPAARVDSPAFYALSVMREVGALHREALRYAIARRPGA